MQLDPSTVNPSVPLNTQELIKRINALKSKPKVVREIKKYLASNTYLQLQINSVIYSVGDHLMINTPDGTDSYSIAQLIKIIPWKGIESLPFWPSIQVKWYYRKNEINFSKNNITDQIYYSISDYEVFSSNHWDIWYPEMIVAPCNVWSYEDYQKQEDNSESTFFMRAFYDIKTEELIPKVSDWEKVCSCEMPLNPDCMYINCDSCEKWFHWQCEGLNEDQLGRIEKFYCKKCNKNIS